MPDDEWITIAEAAQRLSTTVPRLRRLLARPEFASHVTTQERRTRTGTRTSSVLPVSILVPVSEALNRGSEPKQEQDRIPNENKNEQEQTETEAPALIAQMQSEIAFLRAQLAQRDVAESELRRLMLADKQELQELRQRLALPAAPTRSPQSESTEENREPQRRFWLARLWPRK